MSRAVVRNTIVSSIAGVAMLLAACATPDAPDIRGRWRPVNQFAETPVAIPLQQAYIYQASPADGTLKTMLSRWARDSKVSLSYLHPNDYSLHAPVAQIRTSSLEQAAAALTAAYAAQGVRVVADRSQIVVSRAQGDQPSGLGAATGQAE